MISIIITSYKEPKTIGKSIECFVQQKIKEKYELIISAPDEETLDVAKKFSKKFKQIKLFKDEGKGKSKAINQVLKIAKGRVIILTDGDVYVSNNSLNEIIKHFENKKIGCVTGRVFSLNSRNNFLGYWSHLLCYAAHKLREKRNKKNEFLECSGYLWAFRNKIIKKFPLDVGEDTIVPIMFFLKNYKIKYVPNAKVYVKYPTNLNDFIKQKRRAAGAHDNIGKYVNLKKIPRMKTLLNEILECSNLFFYPKNTKEFFWTLLLFPIRLYIWLNLFYNSKIKKRKYSDKWKRIESTK
jgi:cellulose synthase/poly-beta-1,6-N-acetylglucosamine synthase-like glycosyltransferase